MEDLFQEKKSAFVFDSCQNRRLFPFHIPTNRMGSNMPSVTAAPHLGPGYYNNEEKTNFGYTLEQKVGSTKGYALGARTAPRFRGASGGAGSDTGGLGPGAYHLPDNYDELQREAARDRELGRPPFLSATQRFPVFKRDIFEVNPSPGNYEHEVQRNRKVQWQQSFGGTPTNLPSVQQKSTLVQNTDKLRSTKDEKKYQRRLAYMKLFYTD
ncbi:hypothetical protein BOX15_Mlig023260g1 [Macrostomum lignano]|uniref:Uncharacterized protein n=1 Tax=Macrostomum lignano TaxID=282301 RepID=A0A267H6F0_9PLAT|nr:hypothetical protein BOX15_Mlig023260g1 [Macrostomum lignano]